MKAKNNIKKFLKKHESYLEKMRSEMATMIGSADYNELELFQYLSVLDHSYYATYLLLNTLRRDLVVGRFDGKV